EAATGMDRRRFAELPEDLRQWSDQHAVVELNEIVLRSCNKDAAMRYSTCQEMRQELALLQRGKSVKRKRTVQWYWALGRKAGISLVGLGALAATMTVLLRGTAPSDPWPDGAPSASSLANGLCENAINAIRHESYAEFGQAYTNLHRAIELDPGFARPYVG